MMQHRLEAVTHMLDGVPRGTNEQQALLMLLDLNRQMHEELTALRQEVDVLKGSKEVRQAANLQTILKDAVREDMEDCNLELRYHKSFLVNDLPRERGEWYRFIIRKVDAYIRGWWIGANFETQQVPFVVPGNFQNGNKYEVYWESAQELHLWAGPRLLAGARGWELSSITANHQREPSKKLYMSEDVP